MGSQYQANWENYWSTLFADDNLAFWDVLAQDGVNKAIDICKDRFDPRSLASLPQKFLLRIFKGIFLPLSLKFWPKAT